MALTGFRKLRSAPFLSSACPLLPKCSQTTSGGSHTTSRIPWPRETAARQTSQRMHEHIQQAGPDEPTRANYEQMWRDKRCGFSLTMPTALPSERLLRSKGPRFNRGRFPATRPRSGVSTGTERTKDDPYMSLPYDRLVFVCSWSTIPCFPPLFERCIGVAPFLVVQFTPLRPVVCPFSHTCLVSSSPIRVAYVHALLVFVVGDLHVRSESAWHQHIAMCTIALCQRLKPETLERSRQRQTATHMFGKSRHIHRPRGAGIE